MFLLFSAFTIYFSLGRVLIPTFLGEGGSGDAGDDTRGDSGKRFGEEGRREGESGILADKTDEPGKAVFTGVFTLAIRLGEGGKDGT